jgi:hypothetical protein
MHKDPTRHPVLAGKPIRPSQPFPAITSYPLMQSNFLLKTCAAAAENDFFLKN